MTTLLKPAQLADMLGVSEPTIKRWCLRLPEFLSEHANPGHGSHRRLTEKDVRVLRRVKTLLDSGLSLEAIAVQLRKEVTEPLADLTAPSAAGSAPREPWPALEDALARIAIQDQRLAQLEAHFERLNQQFEAFRDGVDR